MRWSAPTLTVTEAVKEAAEDSALPGQRGSWRRLLGALAGNRLVVVRPGDGVDDLSLVEILGALNLRHVADQHAIPHDLGFKSRGAVVVPLGLTAAGQRDANTEVGCAAEQVRVDAAIAESVNHPPGLELLHLTNASAYEAAGQAQLGLPPA